MSLTNPEIVTILKELMEVSKDGEQGYKDAADDVKEKELSEILLNYSVQRGSHIETLRGMIENLGGETEFSGSISGIMNRRWMDVKFGAAGSNPSSILNACIKVERHALDKYEIHLGQDLPDNVRTIIAGQYNTIKTDYDNILKTLEKHNIIIEED